MTEPPSWSSSLLTDVRAILEACGKAYAAANAAMVDAYWRIGRVSLRKSRAELPVPNWNAVTFSIGRNQEGKRHEHSGEFRSAGP